MLTPTTSGRPSSTIGRRELRGEPLGHRDGLGLVADALDEDRELVATLARGDVAARIDAR